MLLAVARIADHPTSASYKLPGTLDRASAEGDRAPRAACASSTALVLIQSDEPDGRLEACGQPAGRSLRGFGNCPYPIPARLPALVRGGAEISSIVPTRPQCAAAGGLIAAGRSNARSRCASPAACASAATSASCSSAIGNRCGRWSSSRSQRSVGICVIATRRRERRPTGKLVSERAQSRVSSRVCVPGPAHSF